MNSQGLTEKQRQQMILENFLKEIMAERQPLSEPMPGVPAAPITPYGGGEIPQTPFNSMLESNRPLDIFLKGSGLEEYSAKQNNRLSTNRFSRRFAAPSMLKILAKLLSGRN